MKSSCFWNVDYSTILGSTRTKPRVRDEKHTHSQDNEASWHRRCTTKHAKDLNLRPNTLAAQVAAQIAKSLGEEFDIEIVEGSVPEGGEGGQTGRKMREVPWASRGEGRCQEKGAGGGRRVPVGPCA
jgi:hypothetical protein